MSTRRRRPARLGAVPPTSAQHLILPALTLGLFYMAVYARLTRAAMLEVADQDFVKTARAKGVPEGAHPAPPRPAQRAAAGRSPSPASRPGS